MGRSMGRDGCMVLCLGWFLGVQRWGTGTVGSVVGTILNYMLGTVVPMLLSEVQDI